MAAVVGPRGQDRLVDPVRDALRGLAKLFLRPLGRMSPGRHRVPPRRRPGARPARMEDRAGPLPGGGCTRAGRRTETALHPPRQTTLILEAPDRSGSHEFPAAERLVVVLYVLAGILHPKDGSAELALVVLAGCKPDMGLPAFRLPGTARVARAPPHAAAGNAPAAAQQMSVLMMSSLRPDPDQPGSYQPHEDQRRPEAEDAVGRRRHDYGAVLE